ncbi:MAG: methyltransferase domain-containing protein [Planctomycetaceae bacterium]|nr:methyltransferase domain-containing protein [Planctomycetales bacterium]MCB9940450.1 methyltransferase domain-containing protein [Planctomycetaceae bacterium]
MTQIVRPFFDACPLCGSTRADSLLTLTDIPTNCHRLSLAGDEARAAPRGDLELVFCGQCELLYNRRFEPGKLIYDSRYENAQHFSPLFQKYITDLATELTATHDLRNKTTLEIGCGDGRFLKLLCSEPASCGIGYDPAGTDTPLADNIQIRTTTFDDQACEPVHFAVSRHVLEHVRAPLDFLKSIHRCLETHNGTIYVEVPNADYMLQLSSTWDLLYEHGLYFTSNALRYAMKHAGFEVLQIQECFGGQFLSAEGIATAGNDGRRHTFAGSEASVTDSLANHAASFGSVVRKSIDRWSDEFRIWKERRISVAIWGAGTKGIMFANQVDMADNLAALVDVNPRKWHRYIPGAAIAISPPDDQALSDVQVVLVMNPIYETEIRQHFANAGWTAEFIVV